MRMRRAKQDAVADRLIELIAGGMDELTVGDPALPSTDVGPVINAAADRQCPPRQRTQRHLWRGSIFLTGRTVVGPLTLGVGATSRLVEPLG